jgi:hypothetical protein
LNLDSVLWTLGGGLETSARILRRNPSNPRAKLQSAKLKVQSSTHKVQSTSLLILEKTKPAAEHRLLAAGLGFSRALI